MNSTKKQKQYLRGLVLLFGLCPAFLFAEEPLMSDLTTYTNKIQPLLERYCYDCHDDLDEKGGIRLDNIDPDILKGKDAYLWDDVLEQLNNGSMPPPKKKKQPTIEEHRTIADYLNKEFFKASMHRNLSKGDSSIRRFTRKEMKYVFKDLIGFSPAYLDNLPKDSGLGNSGFSSNGAYMPFGKPQLFTYLESVVKLVRGFKDVISDKKYTQYFGMDAIIKDLDNPDRENPRKAYTSEEKREMKRKGIGPEWPLFLSQGFVKNDSSIKTVKNSEEKYLMMVIPKPPTVGQFRITLRAKGNASIVVDGGYTEVTFDRRRFVLGTALRSYKITNQDSFQDYCLEGSLQDFPYSVKNGKYEDLIVKIRFNGEADISQVSFAGPVLDLVEATVFQSQELSEHLKVEQWLKDFTLKAFRRPLTPGELSRYKDLYKIMSEEKSPQDAIWFILEDILLSPEFFHVGIPTKIKDGVDNFKLAEKMALFLWSSIPDQILFDLAAQGKLSDPAVLRQQVERMLKDEKSTRFVESFTLQWLHFEDELNNVAINKVYQTNETFKTLMTQETIASLNEVIRNGAPALDLIKADYMMLNRTLARFYGIKGVKHGDFRKVKLPPGSDRGGLLTQASILTAKSDGLNSHAIKRGVWLTEAILGMPPPPPPKAVPDLNQDIPGFENMTLTQKLAVHRDNKACRSCHDKIDPWGILFEEYDAVGKLREKVIVKPAYTPVYVEGSNIKIPKGKRKEIPAVYGEVECSTTLASGQQLSGMQELKNYLMSEQKEQFARNLTRKFLAYAIWRDIQFYDRPLIDRLTEQFVQNNYQVKDLIQDIILSSEFQKSARIQ